MISIPRWFPYLNSLAPGVFEEPTEVAEPEEAGKEGLYPVAMVVMGGLISSTILEFFVRPARFWMVGRGASERLIRETQGEVALVEESFHEHAHESQKSNKHNS